MKENLTAYELSRYWFDFCNNNSDIIKPIHTALYFYILDLCNRLGNPQSFNLPKEFAMGALGVSNWRTYSNALNNLVNWGFINIEATAKNRYSATVISIVKNTIAIKVCSCKKYNAKYNGIVGIINSIPTNVVIPLKTNKTNKLSEACEINFSEIFERYKAKLLSEELWKEKLKLTDLEIAERLDNFFGYIISIGEESSLADESDVKRRFFYWNINQEKTESKADKSDWRQNLINSSIEECRKI